MNTLEHPTQSNPSNANDSEALDIKTVAAKKTSIAIILGLVIVISWMGFLDTQSAAYIDASLKQALVTYGVARGVNAVISMLQTVSLFGLGVGEMLDPLNDLVERFSSVMELAIGSLFVQKILLEITSSMFFKLALTASGGLLILALYVRTGLSTLLISRVFISLVFIRFSIALVVMLNGIVSTAFVTDKIDAEVAVVEQVEKSAPPPDSVAEEAASQPTPKAETNTEPVVAQGAEPTQPVEPEKKGLLGFLGERIKDMGAKALVTVKEGVKKWNPKALKEKIEKVVPQMLNLMALFLLKTLILPLVFLYGLKYALEQVWNINPIPLYTGKPRLTLGKSKGSAN